MDFSEMFGEVSDRRKRGSRTTRRPPAPAPAPIIWPRADPAALAAFDPCSKLCVMNCGPHRDDPRTAKERKFLCGDCSTNFTG